MEAGRGICLLAVRNIVAGVETLTGIRGKEIKMRGIGRSSPDDQWLASFVNKPRLIEVRKLSTQREAMDEEMDLINFYNH